MSNRLVLSLLLVGGCGAGDDEDIEELDGFPYLVDLRVWQYGNGETDVGACVYRYRLCEDTGAVEVEHGAQTLTLGHEPEVSGQWYVGQLSDTFTDVPFRFTWSGADEQSSVTGEVFLPGAFAITAPSAGSTLSASSPVIMEWTSDSPEGLMAWGYYASCGDSTINDFGHPVPDSGRVEIPAGSFSFSGGCSAELWLERLQRGTTSDPRANIMSSKMRFVDVSIGP